MEQQLSSAIIASAGSKDGHLVAGESSRVLDVAVIIVSYKSAMMTIENLRSLAAERSTPGLLLRAIVVDNASGDLQEIAPIVEKSGWSSWVTLIAAPKNGGFAYGNNLGIVSACESGDPGYFYMLNPDAQVRSGAIGSLVQFLETHPDVGIAGSGLEDRNGRDWPIAFRFPTMMSELIQGINLGVITRLLEPWVIVRHMPKRPDLVDWVSGASMMIRPAVFNAIGGMDESYFLFFEETDFCRRAKNAGYSTWYVPESRVMHVGGHSTTLAPDRFIRLPAYWFESRRRYFAVTFGITRAIIIDLISVAAHSFGLAKRLVRRQRNGAVPYFIRDLLRHSILRKRNRHILPFRSRITDA